MGLLLGMGNPTVYEHSPMGHLSGILLHLRVPSTIEALGGRLLGLLQTTSVDRESLLGKSAWLVDDDEGMDVDEDEGADSGVSKEVFRRRLEERFHRSEALMRTRLKVVLSRFCMVRSFSPSPPFSHNSSRLHIAWSIFIHSYT